MRTLVLVLSFLLLPACGGSKAPPAAEEPAARHQHHAEEHHAASGEGHQHHGPVGHRFDDAEVWAKRFDDPARDAWQKPEHVVALLRLELLAYARLRNVGFRLLRAMGRTGPGRSMGTLVTPVTPATARLFALPPDTRGMIVAYVDPDGPAAAQVAPGDVLVAVDGRAVEPPYAYPADLADGPHALAFVRAGERREVTVTAEKLPLNVAFRVQATDEVALLSYGQDVSVTFGLLALLPTDDELAALVAHQLAHLAGGHVAVSEVVPHAPDGTPIADAEPEPAVWDYTEEQERAADRHAVALMAQAGYDPRAARAALETLHARAMGAAAPFWRVHPRYRGRFEEVERAAQVTRRR